MSSVVITLRNKNLDVDVELPTEVPLSVLAPILVERLKWDELIANQSDLAYAGHVISSGIVVRSDETLGGAGVIHGDILELVIHQRNVPKEVGDFPTLYDRIAFLQDSETGELFPCPGRSILIGRTRTCQINLDHLKNSDATSRKHATIIRRTNSYWIRDERSSNGTIVDGVMLPAGGEIRLRNNSQIQFGTDGPLLSFFTPKTMPAE